MVKKFVRKKGRGVRRGRKRRIPRSVGNPRQKVFFYKRLVKLPPIKAIESTGTFPDILQSFSFNLTQVNAYTEFTNLYDSYKFCGVIFRLLPAYQSVVNTNNVGLFTNYTTVQNLRTFTVVDYNDNAAPASIDAMRQYQNCRVSKYTKPNKRYFNPKVNVNATSAQDSIQIFTRKNPWITTASPGLEHDSIKVGIDISLMDPSHLHDDDILYNVECTFYLAFKNPR